VSVHLPGWRATYFADGIGLVSPGGRERGVIRIRDRQRPLRSIDDLVRARIAEMTLGEHVPGPIERIITSEGEHAAVTIVTSTLGDERFERTLGVILGDDFYTVIDGGASEAGARAQIRSAVRALVDDYSIGLGVVRRRRYLYQPPIGWSGYARGLITEWHPAGFPNEAASIAVFPARPVGESKAAVLDRALHELGWHGFTRTSRGDPTPILTRHHLLGAQWRIVGRYDDRPVQHQDIVVLQDDRFHYAMRLESTAVRIDDDREIFHRLLDSIEPIPRARSSRRATAALDHWAE
jgi:hypothetical protein